MSSVNKQSLREEFQTLKVQFECLCADGKMGPESRALFQAVLMLFELLLAVFMERGTTKDSKNSSKPSSQTAKDDTAVSQPGSKGKGKAENNARSGNTRTVETVQVAEVHVCETCGEDLGNTPCVGRERRTKVTPLPDIRIANSEAGERAGGFLIFVPPFGSRGPNAR